MRDLKLIEEDRSTSKNILEWKTGTNGEEIQWNSKLYAQSNFRELKFLKIFLHVVCFICLIISVMRQQICIHCIYLSL